eukprot:jgi/Tetstr1/454200/TSEL_041119.t1
MARRFDAEAAARMFRARWVDVVLELAFGPFARLVRDSETAFSAVPMSRRHPKNKAKVFRFRSNALGKRYLAAIMASRPGVLLLQGTLETTLALVRDAHPSHYEPVRDAFVALLKRWHAVMPPKLVERDEAGVVAYVDGMTERTEECLMQMLDCEERMAAAAKAALA